MCGWLFRLAVWRPVIGLVLASLRNHVVALTMMVLLDLRRKLCRSASPRSLRFAPPRVALASLRSPARRSALLHLALAGPHSLTCRTRSALPMPPRCVAPRPHPRSALATLISVACLALPRFACLPAYLRRPVLRRSARVRSGALPCTALSLRRTPHQPHLVLSRRTPRRLALSPRARRPGWPPRFASPCPRPALRPATPHRAPAGPALPPFALPGRALPYPASLRAAALPSCCVARVSPALRRGLAWLAVLRFASLLPASLVLLFLAPHPLRPRRLALLVLLPRRALGCLRSGLSLLVLLSGLLGGGVALCNFCGWCGRSTLLLWLGLLLRWRSRLGIGWCGSVTRSGFTFLLVGRANLTWFGTTSRWGTGLSTPCGSGRA